MLDLAHYTILETLYEGRDCLIYRGCRSADREPVVIKIPNTDPPMPGQVARLRREYALLSGLDLPGVVKVRALEEQNGGVALVLESLDGEPLDHILRTRRLDAKAALRLAAAVAGILDGVHRSGIVHKDVKPSNILVHRDTGRVHLIDFGMAARAALDGEQESPGALEGTLAYIAPEQTGRMNRPVDRRADLYSLGATLYHMLTAATPFTTDDPVELVHSHLARTPASPHDVDPRIPQAVSDLVMKLLAKAPEDRYQSALGLKADLDECVRQLEAGGAVALELGRRDAAAVLRIPHRLYGREAEERALLATFERVALGAAELVLVSGYSGIGKSALVHGIQRAVAARGGHFVAGKLDQVSRGVPYAPVTRAFRELIQQLLGGRAAELEVWRGRLLGALGGNGQVLIDLIPELSHIIGPQPAVPALGPTESQNRMTMVFTAFVHVFTRPEHPLVLFLDDLQWIDAGSLKLLQILLAGAERHHHLLVIGAYRNSEVGPGHPLAAALEEMREAGVVVTELMLEALGAPDIAELIAGALGCDAGRAAPLAAIVVEKTRGNPFFVSQFLRALHAGRLLRFDVAAGAWQWDLEAIARREVTENVVDLVADKIRLLTPDAQRVLTLAACVGYEIDPRTLSTIHEQPPARIAAALGEAAEEGLVLKVDAAPAATAFAEARYRFLHDRVQQAAYSLIDGADRAATHLRIGRLMLAVASPDQHEEELFDITSHMNRGASLITDARERLDLAELNLAAGKKAKAANAYEAAADRFRSGAAILPADAWETAYALCFALHCELSECEYLCGRFEEAEALFRVILSRARSRVDGAGVYALKLKLCQVAGRYDEGVTIGLEALRGFGIEFPEGDDRVQAATAAEAAEIRRALEGRPIATLLDAKLMEDPEHRAVLGLLTNVMPCAYIGRPSAFPLVALKAVSLSLRHGNAPESCFAYSVYGFMLVAVFGDIPAGYELSETSIRLNERFGDAALTGTLLHLHGDHINFWVRHIRTGFPILERAFQACLSAGDLVYAGYLAFETVWQAVERGDALDDLLELTERFAAFARRSKNHAVHETIRMEQQFALCLKGLTRDEATLDGDGFREEACLAEVTRASFGCGIAFYHIIKLILLYMAGRIEEALAAAAAARGVLGAVMAMPIEATFHFYEALALIARGAGPDSEAFRGDQERIEANLEKLERWARHCPENFGHKLSLVRAEAARAAGRHIEAEALYDEAIESAREGGFTPYEALSCELAARAFLERGRRFIAPAYARAAYGAYVRWGALAMAERIARTYPETRSPGVPLAAGGQRSAGSTTGSGSRGMSGLIDVTTMVRLGQAIAGEMELPGLLDRIMRAALANAGATRGCLILEREGELRVEATVGFDSQSEAGAGSERRPGGLSAKPSVAIGLGVSIEDRADLPSSVVHYVSRTREAVVLSDAGEDARFAGDPCIASRRVKSVVCLPLVHQSRLVGALYLENALVRDAFGPGRVELLDVLCSQAATALENALLYGHVQEASEALRRANERLEADVAQRTEDLREVNAKLTRELEERARAESDRAALQEEVIRMQTELLEELSTPMIPITDEIMVLPLIGMMDTRRAQHVMETALGGVQRSGAKVVIIDITGMRSVDVAVAGALLRTATALRLLGTHALLTGVSPEIARTLVELHVDLGGIVTCGSLQSGIALAARAVGRTALGTANHPARRA